jgi:hypothetical protein
MHQLNNSPNLKNAPVMVLYKYICYVRAGHRLVAVGLWLKTPNPK